MISYDTIQIIYNLLYFFSQEWFVCRIEEFDQNSKKRFQVQDRDIVIIRRGEKFFALDSFCYRMCYMYGFHLLVFKRNFKVVLKWI